MERLFAIGLVIAVIAGAVWWVGWGVRGAEKSCISHGGVWVGGGDGAPLCCDPEGDGC